MCRRLLLPYQSPEPTAKATVIAPISASHGSALPWPELGGTSGNIPKPPIGLTTHGTCFGASPMPSPANEADVARVLWRAAQECESKQGVRLGKGLPQALRGSIGSQAERGPAELALVEVVSISPSGVATTVVEPPSLSCPVIGLSASDYEGLDSLIQTQDETGIAIIRLICPFAVFDFGPNGLVVREIRHGLTAADLQQKLNAPLWAGPDLKELGTH